MEAKMAAVERAEQAETAEAVAPPSSGGEVLLKGRYGLLLDVPLPAYDSPTAKAYAVKDKSNPGLSLFAHVCVEGMPLYWLFLERQRQQNIAGVLQLVAEDVVTVPSIGNACPVFIYAQPGVPFRSSLTGPVTVKAIETVLLAPVVEALRELEALNITHRGIRPDNLFLSESKETPGVLLGDCVSSPAAYNQPVLFEPIESALANPAGRGQGTVADDVYALGVTVLVLFLGKLPIKDMDPEAILAGKIEKGSYDFLTGEIPATQIPLRIKEFLKGTLHDTAEKRWGITQLEGWLNSYQAQSVPNVPSPERHVFSFMKEQYTTGRSLARALLKHPKEGCKALREPRFESWAVRSIADQRIARTVAEEVAKNRASPVPAEQLVARIAILLDPDAPIRYKSFSALIDGFGGLLATQYADDQMRRDFSDVAHLHLPQLWLSVRGLEVRDNRKAMKRFQRLKHFLGRRGFGFGLARWLYELVPGLGCQSALVLPEYCVKISDLLPALEVTAGKLEVIVEPMDEHIAAFIASRFSAKIDTFLFSLTSPPGSAERVLGVLGLLASLQNRYGPEQLPQLAGWVWKLLPPVLASYHNQVLRKQLGEQMEKIAAKGSLVELYNLVGNPTNRQADQRAYGVARNQFMRSLGETAQINLKLKRLSTTSFVFGHLLASRVSLLIALVAISIALSKYI